jgi:hypothetical protein
MPSEPSNLQGSPTGIDDPVPTNGRTFARLEPHPSIVLPSPYCIALKYHNKFGFVLPKFPQGRESRPAFRNRSRIGKLLNLKYFF